MGRLAHRLGESAELDPDALDRRLEPTSRAPIAVAVSGGGDSMAALILTAAWASRHDRPVLALNVDHGLQAQSADWAGFVAVTARRLGVDFRALSWTDPKPAWGLPAAARAARHRLIAQAAREAGARVVVFGHTADDVLEAALMRAEGLRVGSPREWGPSPVWPEGRDLFLLRPLLGARRAAIRAWLAGRGDVWIEDPANIDPASPRARARSRLAGGGVVAPFPLQDTASADLAAVCECAPAGWVRFERERLRRAPAAPARRVLGAAALSVGGGEPPPRGERLERLCAAALGEAPFKATLAGARIIADRDTLLLARDAGEAARGGLRPMPLPAGRATVWDGRFELTANEDGLHARALAGLTGCLGSVQRRALRAVPTAARPGLPVLQDASGAITCPILPGPILSGVGDVYVRTLTAPRFLAACGAISKEPAT